MPESNTAILKMQHSWYLNLLALLERQLNTSSVGWFVFQIGLAIVSILFRNVQSRWLNLTKKLENRRHLVSKAELLSTVLYLTLYKTQQCLPVCFTTCDRPGQRATSALWKTPKCIDCCSYWIKEKKSSDETETYTCQARETDFLSPAQQIFIIFCTVTHLQQKGINSWSGHLAAMGQD